MRILNNLVIHNGTSDKQYDQRHLEDTVKVMDQLSSTTFQFLMTPSFIWTKLCNPRTLQPHWCIQGACCWAKYHQGHRCPNWDQEVLQVSHAKKFHNSRLVASIISFIKSSCLIWITSSNGKYSHCCVSSPKCQIQGFVVSSLELRCVLWSAQIFNSLAA